ncbi:ECF transporter S component [Streptococcus sp. NLN64]|uniref:ECF transporter S component n=1 Tax=Streptococcus sp. NLN64 TaxID=2822799 RepID=UPI0018C9D8D3|nr:ECF transporter S component [Streptococcus sp. NLN64]MBG9366632.1 ECF transporter S component [Streptococcus sp. NLN64]
MRRSNTTAVLAIFLAAMLVIQWLSGLIFNILPFVIRPTLIHIPVIIGSIRYGPKTGMILGFFMGLISMINNTLFIQPTSYLFTPFVENGSWASLMIAFVPRILIGLFPSFIYRWIPNRLGLGLAGVLGSLTNTFFVLSGIFLLFPSIYQGNLQTFLAAILTTNSLAEMALAGFITAAAFPILKKN